MNKNNWLAKKQEDLPDFIIGGAMKCGTTTLHDMLSKSRVVEILPYKHGRKVRVIHHTDPIQQTSNTAKIVQITPGTGGDCLLYTSPSPRD